MLAPIIVFVITCLIMIASVLFFPKLKIGKIEIGVYWIVTLAGAIIVFLCSPTDIHKHGVKFGCLDFIKIGATVSLPTLFAALGALWICTSLF